MQYLVTGKEMKLLDQNTSTHFHMPELVLMEQAAIAFVQKLFLLSDEKKHTCKRALVVCGAGNNGADGLAVARLLTQRKVEAYVFPVGEAAGMKMSDSYRHQKQVCEAYHVSFCAEINPAEHYDLVIDAVFGTGLSRKVEGAPAAAIHRMNELLAWKVALDISSGLSSDNGEVMGSCFAADDTITFSFGKRGQFLWPGNEYSGQVHIVPIGITEESFLERKPKMAYLTQEDLCELPQRRAHSNKGTYGKLLVIAGSVNMAGAACLCAKAAYRSGVGLVRVLTAEENRTILQTAVPEAVLTTYGSKPDKGTVIAAIQWADAIVMGPGIGTAEPAGELLEYVLECAGVPVVFDADALNLIAREPEILRRPHPDLILTPHLGEMSRLTGESVDFLQSEICEAAQQLAQNYEVICVLKDFRTITAVPYGLSYMNLSGNDGMATAGSGDVLSGVIGALLAQGMKPSLAAPYGVYLHGLAGDAAAAKVGKRALMARDLIEEL